MATRLNTATRPGTPNGPLWAIVIPSMARLACALREAFLPLQLPRIPSLPAGFLNPAPLSKRQTTNTSTFSTEERANPGGRLYPIATQTHHHPDYHLTATAAASAAPKPLANTTALERSTNWLTEQTCRVFANFPVAGGYFVILLNSTQKREKGIGFLRAWKYKWDAAG